MAFVPAPIARHSRETPAWQPKRNAKLHRGAAQGAFSRRGPELPRGGKIVHAYCTELLFTASDPGQNARHVDAIWPLWNLFDFTPEGRDTNWYPKLAYETGER